MAGRRTQACKGLDHLRGAQGQGDTGLQGIGLANSGDLSEAQVKEILHFEGWEPVLAAQVAAKWTAGTGAAGKSETRAELSDEYQGGYITEAEYRSALGALGYHGHQLDLEVHVADARRVKKAYLARHLTDAEALTRLAQTGITGEAATLLIPLWQLEREVATKQLTPAQIRSAYRKATITQDEALAELADRGYTSADANTYLAT